MIVPLLLLILGSGLAIAITMCVPTSLRVPVGVFNGLYILTTAIGSTIIAIPIVRQYWVLLFPTIDQRWFTEGGSFVYWFLVWAPMVVTNLAVLISYPRLRLASVQFARLINKRVDIFPALCAGLLMVGYCLANLAYRGYLSVGTFSGKTMGMYRENIQLRTEMFKALGTLHFACLYMGIPAIAMVALYNASRRRSLAWLALFVLLSGCLLFLYATTLTKSNILIYGLEVTIGARVLGLIGWRGVTVAVLLGLITLSLLMYFLAGSGPLNLAVASLDVIFREASGVPFYAAIFPKQVPFTGIDLGLGEFGLGSPVTANLIVANYMFPGATWVQGSASAAANISSYAQGGYVWSFVTMAVAGAWVAFSGQMRRVTHGPIMFSAFIGSVVTCYYLTQADFVGAFNVSYGYKWWMASLILLLGIQSLMQRATRTHRLAESPRAFGRVHL